MARPALAAEAPESELIGWSFGEVPYYLTMPDKIRYLA